MLKLKAEQTPRLLRFYEPSCVHLQLNNNPTNPFLLKFTDSYFAHDLFDYHQRQHRNVTFSPLYVKVCV